MDYIVIAAMQYMTNDGGGPNFFFDVFYVHGIGVVVEGDGSEICLLRAEMWKKALGIRVRHGHLPAVKRKSVRHLSVK